MEEEENENEGFLSEDFEEDCISSEEQDEILKLISNKPAEKFNKEHVSGMNMQFNKGGSSWMPNPDVKKVDRSP
jgi:hypothetical protein